MNPDLDALPTQRLSNALSQVSLTVQPLTTKGATYILDSEDLATGIPKEYREARLAPSLREAMNRNPLSIAMVGPPGTGKTRQCYAALIASRLKRAGHVIGHTETFDSRWSPPPREVWVKRHVGADVVRIISESGDILMHRYDRAWLEEVASFSPWLMVDDIGFSKPSDWSIEALYHIANERRKRHLPTLWTTNLKADEIRSTYTPAIASRILAGDIIDLGGVDRRIA